MTLKILTIKEKVAIFELSHMISLIKDALNIHQQWWLSVTRTEPASNNGDTTAWNLITTISKGFLPKMTKLPDHKYLESVFEHLYIIH